MISNSHKIQSWNKDGLKDLSPILPNTKNLELDTVIFSLYNDLIQNYRYFYITFRKGWIAPFKGSFGDTQNGHVHVWCQHQVSGIKFTFLIHFRRLNWIFVFGFSDLLRSSEIAKSLLCPRNTPHTLSHMDFKKVPHTRNCSTTTWLQWQKKDH